MTTQSIPRYTTNASAFDLLLRIAGAARRSLADFRRAYTRYATIRQLQALDERTLRDIGVMRGDIAAAVDERLD